LSTADLILEPPRGRSGARIALAVLGTIFCLAVIGIGTLALLNVAARHTFRTTADYSGVRLLVVNSTAGDVSLTSAPAGAPLTVEQDVTEGLTTPTSPVVLTGGGELLLRASCAGAFECSVHYVVAVPMGVAIRVSTRGGAITATGLTSTASIQLSSGTGDVTAIAVSAPSIRLHSGLGHVTAQLTRPANALVATAGTGDVHLTVPDTTYALHVSSGTGTVSHHNLTINPTAPRTIDASSSLGDVTIAVSH
jgi:hypothetical protein